MNYPFVFLLSWLWLSTSSVAATRDNQTVRRLYKGVPMTNDSIRKAVNYYLKDTMVGESVYGPMSEWDTSEVTDMSRLFEGQTSFNEVDIEQWDTSQVTTFAYMFAGCKAFNQPLGAWDLTSAKTLEGMFNGATSFNQDIRLASGWRNTAFFVTNMAAMFKGASQFNGDVAGLLTNNVVDMNMMFYGATSFQGQGMQTWKVDKVERMDRMFFGCSNFNGDITGWAPKRVTTMQSMFQDAITFNQDIGTGWRGQMSPDLAVVSQMFYHAQSFDHKICWTGLAPRIKTNKMFCGSPGSLNTSCLSNPTSVLQWAESCTAEDESVFGNNNNLGFNGELDGLDSSLLPENVVVVSPGETNGSAVDEDGRGEMVIVGVTTGQQSKASTFMLGCVATLLVSASSMCLL